MPIAKIDKINTNSVWCLWEITESKEQLMNKLVLSEDGKHEIEMISHPVKQKERLAARCCVQELVKHIGKEYEGIVKDEHDKPHLVGLNHHISITHSFPYAAAILHKKLPVGIDIQKPVEKLGRIAHRFLNEQEFSDSQGDVKKICVYWAGKEAIYKLNGKVGLNFKNDIEIAPFELHKRDVVKSVFSIGENSARIALNYQEFRGHIVAYCF
jgi:4'-phosphopantetheinyl transferase